MSFESPQTPFDGPGDMQQDKQPAIMAIKTALNVDDSTDCETWSNVGAKRLIKSLQRQSLSAIYLQCQGVQEDVTIAPALETMIGDLYAGNILVNLEDQELTGLSPAQRACACSDYVEIVKSSIQETSTILPAIIQGISDDPSKRSWEEIATFIEGNFEMERTFSATAAEILATWEPLQDQITAFTEAGGSGDITECRAAWNKFRAVSSELLQEESCVSRLSALHEAFDTCFRSTDRISEDQVEQLKYAASDVDAYIQSYRKLHESMLRSSVGANRFLQLAEAVYREMDPERDSE